MNDKYEAKRVLVQEWDRLSIKQIEANVNAIFKDFEEEIEKHRQEATKWEKAFKAEQKVLIQHNERLYKKLKKLKKKLSKYRTIIRYLENKS